MSDPCYNIPEGVRIKIRNIWPLTSRVTTLLVYYQSQLTTSFTPVTVVTSTTFVPSYYKYYVWIAIELTKVITAAEII